MNARIFFALTALAAAPLPAQLARPNADGVSMGHIHLAVKDVDAHKQFWTETMGGTLVKSGPLEMIRFPGVFILLRQAEPSGAPAGSIVNHFGFVVKDMQASIAKWKQNHIKIEQGENPNQAYVTAPDDIRVEIFGDPSISTAILMNHIHFYPTDIHAMQGWYAKTFGGVAGTRARVARPGRIDSVDLPGVNLSFSQGEKALAPTKGRSLDHIGFEVKDLDAFVAKLQAQGIKLDVAPRMVPNSNLKIAFLTDPWGTYIELTQGLVSASAPSDSR